MLLCWLLSNIFKNSNIKNKNRIGDKGDLCGMPVGVGIELFL